MKMFFVSLETDITRPMFDGTGYLSFPISETKSIRHLTSFSLDIKTEASDGMILWIGEVNSYFCCMYYPNTFEYNQSLSELKLLNEFALSFRIWLLTTTLVWVFEKE